MSCLKIPVPELQIPAPFGIPEIGASIDFGGLDFCCTFKIPVDIPPIALPPGSLNPAIIQTLNQSIEIVLAALRQVPPLNCPKSGE